MESARRSPKCSAGCGIAKVEAKEAVSDGPVSEKAVSQMQVSLSDRLSFGQRIALLVIPKLAALLLAVIGATLRFEVIAEEGAVPETPPGSGIYCFWHRCTLPCGWYFRKFHCSILISRSFDGELIAQTLQLLGYTSVRGSSSRGGAASLLALQSLVERGVLVVFTADGPRGPIYQTKIGPVKLAQMTGQAMGSFYLLPERAWVMRSWDRFLIPKPFSRVAVSWARKVAAPPAGADSETLEATRQQLNAALERARERAEEHFRLH
jgi:lysophospholipid acyltransferase (LPLAT)-like uncharacterized protein